MIIREIIYGKPLVIVILLLVSPISYFQFTLSEFTKARKGERSVLMPLRWIVFCFISSLLLLWMIPFLFVMDMFSHFIMSDLPLFFTLSFLHIMLVSLFITLGTLPVFLVQRQIENRRALFRVVEFGYVLYLTALAGSGFLEEIQVGLVFPFKEIAENRWGIITLLAIMIPLYLGVSVLIMLIWKYIIKKWIKEFENKNDN